MAHIIQQVNVFGYTQIEFLGDLERIYLAIENIDDERLVSVLNK